MTNDIKLIKPVSTSKPTTRKKKVAASLDKRKARAGWGFVLPFVLGFVLVYLPILVESIKYSFCKLEVQATGGFLVTFVGWENYREALFVNPDFVKVLLTGMEELAFDIPAIVIFSLFMAVILNQKMVGRAVFRAIFFIPVILSTGLIESIDAMSITDDYMEDADGISQGTGQSTAAEIVSAMDVERLFANMQIGTGIVEYVTHAVNNIYDIVNRSGVQMLIFLSGLQSISPAIYESCQIDGATGWETFWKITFPMISPMILVNGVYTIIDAFTTNSNSVMTFISEAYTQTDGQVISSAMSWMYFLIVIVIVAIVAAIFSMYVFYQRRDK